METDKDRYGGNLLQQDEVGSWKEPGLVLIFLSIQFVVCNSFLTDCQPDGSP